MSKILNGLKDLERHRRQDRDSADGDALLLDEARAAEAVALTKAGADERASREAQESMRTDAELLAAIERRVAAERLAASQARSRSESEAAAESAAAERAHAERMLDSATRMRVEAEEKALADAKRREFASAELTTAATQRAQREQQAEALARERAESERRAIELATEKIRAEQAAEAAALARAASERDVLFHAERRALQEAAAQLAEAERRQAEQEATDAGRPGATAPVRVASPLPPRPPVTASHQAVSPTPTFLGRQIKWLLGVAIALTVGLGAGYWVGSQWAPGKRITLVTDLRLDRDVDQFVSRLQRLERWHAATGKPRR